MDIVAVAVVGGAQGDDGLERGWTQRRHLQGVEAAPGNAHHANRAAAPTLPGQPGDDFDRIKQLLLRVLVMHQAIGDKAQQDVDAIMKRGGYYK